MNNSQAYSTRRSSPAEACFSVLCFLFPGRKALLKKEILLSSVSDDPYFLLLRDCVFLSIFYISIVFNFSFLMLSTVQDTDSLEKNWWFCDEKKMFLFVVLCHWLLEVQIILSSLTFHSYECIYTKVSKILEFTCN